MGNIVESQSPLMSDAEKDVLDVHSMAHEAWNRRLNAAYYALHPDLREYAPAVKYIAGLPRKGNPNIETFSRLSFENQIKMLRGIFVNDEDSIKHLTYIALISRLATIKDTISKLTREKHVTNDHVEPIKTEPNVNTEPDKERDLVNIHIPDMKSLSGNGRYPTPGVDISTDFAGHMIAAVKTIDNMDIEEIDVHSVDESAPAIPLGRTVVNAWMVMHSADDERRPAIEIVHSKNDFGDYFDFYRQS